MKHFINNIILIAFTHLLFLPSLWAENLISTKDSIPLDSSIRYGRLPNGFTYYIKNVPGAIIGKMEFFVKVGSYYHEENQLDFAHMVEHLAFKTAQHFPAPITEKLKTMNIKNIGGQTGSLWTAYNFNIPLNNLNAFDSGLLWFRDVADLKLTNEAIDNERGVMRQEAVYKVGSRLDEFFLETKLLSKLFPCKKDLSQFFEHNMNFSSQSLIDFYNTWYRPERMGVVIAGEIKNIDKLEKRIKKQFSNIPVKKASITESLDCRLKWMDSSNRFVSLTRKQKNNGMDINSVKIFLLTRDKKTLSLAGKWQGVQRKYLWKILTTMINQRLGENKNMSGISFLPPKPRDPFYQFVILINDSTEQKKIEGLCQLVQQIKQYGFTAKEWEFAQEDIIQKLGNTSSSAYWTDQMSLHFINEEILPINKNVDLKKWLDQLTLDDINYNVDQFLSDTPNDIGVIAPNGHKASAYSKSEVLEWFRSALKFPANKYLSQVEAPTKPLLSDQEIKKLKKVSYIDQGLNEIGIEELELSNGVKIVLVDNGSSERFNSKIQIHGFRPKGALCFPKSDYFSAINAPLMVKIAGVGKMDVVELQAAISNTSFAHSIYPYIEPFETGFKISGEKFELEKMLQLVYLYYTNKSEIKQKAYEHWKKIERRWYIEPSINPMSFDFKIAMSDFLNDNSAVLKAGTKRFNGILKTDKNRAIQIYRQLYGNASEFTFIINGSFEKKVILPLIQKYLGNLPNTDKVTCQITDHGKTDIPVGPQFVKFFVNKKSTSYKMNNSAYYMLRFVSKSKEPSDWKEQIKVVILGRLINFVLSDFRYKKNAALYDFSGFGNYNRYLNAFSLGISLQCEIQELEWLREECKNTIDFIKKNGFSQEQFDEVFANSIKIWYEAKPNEKPKHDEIYNYYRYNIPLVDKQEREHFVNSLTVEDIQKTAEKYLKKEFMLEFVMQDENTNSLKD